MYCTQDAKARARHGLRHSGARKSESRDAGCGEMKGNEKINGTKGEEKRKRGNANRTKGERKRQKGNGEVDLRTYPFLYVLYSILLIKLL